MSGTYSVLNHFVSPVAADQYVQFLRKRFSGSEAGLAYENLPDKSGKKNNEGSFPVLRLGISGAGMMGCSIAAAFIRHEIPVVMYDILLETGAEKGQDNGKEPMEGFAALVRERVRAELILQQKDSVSSGTMESVEQTARELTQKYLTLAQSGDDLATLSVILETIPEKIKMKQKHYIQLDSLFLKKNNQKNRGNTETANNKTEQQDHCQENRQPFLLTNTSTLQISLLAESLKKTRYFSPTRFCGFHFFHPVRKRSLVEIISGTETLPETIDKAVSLARKIEKTPIIVHDGPGFLVNRLLNPYLTESLLLLSEGVPMRRIERVCLDFGMEIGPFRIMDEIGLDVALHSGWTFFKAFPDRMPENDILPQMIRLGMLGRKSGCGFYRYQGSQTLWEDEGVWNDELPQQLNLKFDVSEESAPDDDEIILRIFGGILLEAGRIVQDDIVDDFMEADRALVLGLGFPPAKGGICFWANSLGLDKLLNAIESVSDAPRFLVPAIFRDGRFSIEF